MEIYKKAIDEIRKGKEQERAEEKRLEVRIHKAKRQVFLKINIILKVNKHKNTTIVTVTENA